VGVLTRRNEGEEEDFRPDVIHDSGLQFLPRKRALYRGLSATMMLALDC